MSRIPELSPESMTDEQRAVADEIVSGPHRRIVGPYPAWLQSPDLARRARSLSEFIRFRSSLPRHLSELAILVAGSFWRAEFEFYAHSILAKEAGVDEAVIAALAQQRRPPFQHEDEELVYDVCSQLFETRRLSEALYGRAVEALGLPTVVELVATIGYYSMVSLTLNAFDVSLPSGERSPFPDAKPAQ
ncbi:MAG TPA: carboxymuconolactone decarboxylase family protein [bacterium]|nr:carboxymuconolactone decarboxylase family protein [bacterium]